MSDKQHAFEINGAPYEIALPSTFDMDESQIFHDYTGFVVEEIWLNDLGWNDLGKRPGFLTALVHISYRRQNDDVTDAEIKSLIGKQNRLEMFGSLLTAILPDDEPAESEEGKELEPVATS